MQSPLPNLARKDIKRALKDAPKFVREFIRRLHPATEFSEVQAYSYYIPRYGLVVIFELYHADIWEGVFTEFRTGRVTMWFSPNGKAFSISWDSKSYSYHKEGLGLRPLWLPHHFWDAIPVYQRLLDPDYSPDPFEGAADFKPAADSVNEVL